MQTYLLGFPLWFLFIVLVVGGALLAGMASWLVGRYRQRERAENEIGLAIFQTVGAIFGITLAFTISVVHGEFQEAVSNVARESNGISNLYWLSKKLPASEREELRAALHRYTALVVDSEWPAMMRGEQSAQVDEALERLWQVQRDFPTDGHTVHALEERLYQQLRTLTDHRRDRLFDSRTRLAPLMWALLLGGGLITVAFAVYLRTGDNRSQAAMTSALAAVVGAGLLLVMALDAPFSGTMHVPADPIRGTLPMLQADQDSNPNR